MPFEDRTAEVILQEMLDSIAANVDKRQGSIIYDALAPKAVLIAKFYQDLSYSIDNFIMVDTATEQYLDDLGYQYGVDRKQATKSERNATFIGTTPVANARFFTEDGLYWIYDGAKVACETAGSVGNSTVTGSNLIPVENITGLTSATLGSIVTPGADTESDAEYRVRILTKLREPELNSNKAQIKAWCLENAGVSKVRIFPLWNGVNTVKGVLLGVDGQGASTNIVQQVQAYIDPNSQGLGEGKADIGCVFTASSATVTPINLSVKITQLATGKTIEDAKPEITSGLTAYLKSIAFAQEKIKDVVRYQEISAMILNTDAVIDFEQLTINAGSANIEIDLDKVATVGTLSITQ